MVKSALVGLTLGFASVDWVVGTVVLDVGRLPVCAIEKWVVKTNESKNKMYFMRVCIFLFFLNKMCFMVCVFFVF